MPKKPKSIRVSLPINEPDWWVEGNKVYYFPNDNDAVAGIEMKLPKWLMRCLRDNYNTGREDEKKRIRQILGL